MGFITAFGCPSFFGVVCGAAHQHDHMAQYGAAVRHGAILYLDEVVEARKDTMVVIHPLTDHRRVLTMEKLGRVLRAPDRFMLVVSYNPGYQSVLKELKQLIKR